MVCPSQVNLFVPAKEVKLLRDYVHQYVFEFNTYLIFFSIHILNRMYITVCMDPRPRRLNDT